MSCPSERSFTNTGEKSGTFDAILSEDSFLHAAGTQQRQKAIAECARLLKPGGVLAFTDIMQSATCNKDLSAVYERIDLTDLGSVSQYKQWAQENGLLLMDFEDLSHQLPIHYRCRLRPPQGIALADRGYPPPPPEGHRVVRSRWAPPPTEGKGPREGQRRAIGQ